MKKNRWLKKVVAYVLSLCMLLSGLFVAAPNEVRAEGTTMVYFLNTDGWSDIKVHGWIDGGNQNLFGGWPGASAVAANEIGVNWWKIEVPCDASVQAFHIMFTDNGSDTSRMQTYITNKNDVYLTTETDKSYSSPQAAETAMGVRYSTTLYFYNSAGWATVYGYAYAPGANGGEEIGASYPGVQAVVANEIGANWWRVTVPRNASTSPFNIIFNDGTGNNQSDAYITDLNEVYMTVGNQKYASAQAAQSGVGGSTGGSGGGNTGVNPDLDYGVDLSGVGAALAYTTYEAENASTNGQILPKSTSYLTDIQSEASGRSAVKLTNTGDYVEFTLTKPANAFVVRYSMPDSADGAGINANLSLYVNGTDSKDLALTSKYAWIYGSYPYTNNPGNGKGHRFFDETRVFFSEGEFPAGTKIKLQKDAGDTASHYIIDFIECELVDDALAKPADSLSITDYGAVANDGQDDFDAINQCIEAAKSQKKEVWIPEGTFDLSAKRSFDVSDVTIRGAGMWYSNLSGAGASFHYQGTCKFYDFAMTGVSTVRDDGGDLAAFEGTGTATNVTIENIWIEHVKVGLWSYNTTNLVVQGCRIRNTYADGINLCSATNNAMIRNNSLRNTGDDCIAIWPWQGDSCDNTIAYNTVQCPTLANGIALYGGSGNKVEYNYVSDSINNGSGICLGTDYDTPNGFTGTTTVSKNVLVRCGSYHCDYNYQIGAIWIWATKKPMRATFDITNNTLYDCSYEGVLIDNHNSVSGLNIKDNNIYGATTDGVFIRGTAGGEATFENLGVAEYGGELLKNEVANFTVNQSGNGIHETDMPNSGEKQTYTVTYVLNNDAAVNNSANLGSYEEGKVVVLNDPMLEGYQFEGWYTSSNFAEGTKVTTLTLNANTTVYAKWAKRVQSSTAIYFYNSAGWATVYGYAYAPGANGGEEISASYPGAQAVAANEIGANWWKVTVSRNASTSPFNIIFNDGTGNNQSDAYITDLNEVYMTVGNQKYASAQAAQSAVGGSGGGNTGGSTGGSGGGNTGGSTEENTGGSTEENTGGNLDLDYGVGSTEEVPVSEIHFQASAYQLIEKGTVQLQLAITPSNAANKAITYTSSDEKVAVVSQSGVVTGISAGTATITATSANGKKAICTVTVRSVVSSINLNASKKTLGVKEKFQLTAIAYPTNAANAAVTFKSLNPKVATVNAMTGMVTAKKRGTALIEVSTANGAKVTCKITVKKAPKYVRFTAKKKTIEKGKTLKLKAKLSKGSAGKITYASSKKKVVKVDASGKIKALKKGKAVITAKTYNKKKAKITIYVR